MTQTAEKKDNANYSDHFTRIPNIVFVSYKHLTKEEKFLYARLRCLYWDTTPHDLSLRELAELTGYSAGALSKMLPRLHKVGLIHAEIKKKQGKNGKETGNPVYHVSITDIWEINKRYFTCSFGEQVDPSDVLVHENTQACSPNETSSFTKCDKPVSFGEQVRAQKHPIKKEKILSKKKEEATPAKEQPEDRSSSSSEKEASSSQPQPNNNPIATASKVSPAHEPMAIGRAGQGNHPVPPVSLTDYRQAVPPAPSEQATAIIAVWRKVCGARKISPYELEAALDMASQGVTPTEQQFRTVVQKLLDTGKTKVWLTDVWSNWEKHEDVPTPPTRRPGKRITAPSDWSPQKTARMEAHA